MSSKYVATAAIPADSSTDRLHWSSWVGWAALVWSLGYGLAGIWWALGGAGFPFGPGGDEQSGLSIFGGLTVETAAPAFAVAGILLAALALFMTVGRAPRGIATLLAGVGWAIGIFAVAFVPDYRLLVIAGYAPVFLVGAPFGWPGEASLLDAISLPVVNQMLFVVGGFAWIGLAVVFARRNRGACERCGLDGGPAGWTAPAAARRWGRWAVAVAVLVPLVYAATRWAWALGIPLGISEEFLREGQESGMWLAGAGLATVAVAGAILTLGLAQSWGERVPRWVPALGARSIPPWLAIAPALVVAALATSAGLMFVRMVVTDQGFFDLREAIGAIGPELLWPIWGVALAAAAVAYGYRRRGTCPRCGRAPLPAE